MMPAFAIALLLLQQPGTPLRGPQAPALKAPENGENVLQAGSPAPSLSVDDWVKGEPVEKFEKGKVYVVEFWATWCGPCIRGIPHLTELQRQHPGLVIIGVAAAERPTPPRATSDGAAPTVDPRLAGVRDFVGKRGEDIGYRIAWDGDSSMGKAWMVAAKRRSIPCAFIVDRSGRIAWIGNPAEMDGMLAKLMKEPSSPSEPGDGPSAPAAP